jgi:hypothetical protein
MPSPTNPTEPMPGRDTLTARDTRPFHRTHESNATYFDSTLKLLPGVTIPLRAMKVSTVDRQILISPIGTAEEAAEIDVAPLTVVAPSLLHHLHLETAIERYRPVALWGPPGLAEKVPDLGPMHVFGEDPWPHADQLEFVIVEGAPKRNEVVFFHKASKTIYTADLFFNIREPQGLLTPLTFRLMGIYKRFAAAKMWRRWVTDRIAFQRSIEQILAWDFERIVVAHGDPVERDAHVQFEAALRELELIP